jgi:dihydrofolate reductase
MRKVIANVWMTLDGVVQAPSYADEDVTGGFEHGGWHTRYFDDLSMGSVIENVSSAGGFLLGRGTYEMFAAHWPSAPEEQQVLAEPLLQGDLREAVRALKSEEGRDLHVIGSPGLAQSLIELGVLDELRLMIDPLVVGGGKRLFRDDGALRPLRLVDSQVTTTGAIIVNYAVEQA